MLTVGKAETATKNNLKVGKINLFTMKENLLLLFMLISTFSFSQESVYEITNQSGTIIIKTGTTAHNAPTYLGSNNLDELTSSGVGSIVIKRNGITYTPTNQTPITPTFGHSIYLGGTIFSELNINFSQKRTASTFDENGSSTIQLSGGPFSYFIESWSGEEPSGLPNDNKTKTLWYDVHLSSTFVNNLLENDEVWILNRSGTMAVTGGFANGNDSLILTKVGTQLVVTYDTGYNQVTLSNNVVEKENEILTIFPNPTNNFITIQNKKNLTENFEYKIVDLAGRIVKCDNSKFNELINIESLESGNYIIQIETENGKKLTEKLIKN